MRHAALPAMLLLVGLGCNQQQDSSRRTGAGAPDQGVPEAPQGREPPAAVVGAWYKAGGHYGGMKPNPFGSVVLAPRDAPGEREPRDAPAADELPAFHFRA